VDNVAAIGSAIASVQVLVDGSTVGNAIYGMSRPDVCAAYPGRPGCPNVGFVYSLNPAGLGTGAHTIMVSATNSIGTVGTTSTAITVASKSQSLQVDSPTAGSVVSGIISVGGWDIDSESDAGTQIRAVKVLVDGAVVGNAAYGVSRPDVCPPSGGGRPVQM
jgi:N-acetylmuramoyl-L-alanine amidase